MIITPPKKIKIEMIKKGITGAEIARNAGVTRIAIYHIIEGRRRSPRLRRAISAALDLPRSIWEEMDRGTKAA